MSRDPVLLKKTFFLKQLLHKLNINEELKGNIHNLTVTMKGRWTPNTAKAEKKSQMGNKYSIFCIGY